MSDSPRRPLRSRQWFGRDGKQRFYYRSWLICNGDVIALDVPGRQAHLGTDLDFLVGGNGDSVTRDSD